MKKWRKNVMLVLCVCMLFGLTACGARNDRNNNSATEQNDNMGGAIDDGIHDVGEAIDDGMNAVGDGVQDITDDVTNQNRNQEQ